MNESKIALVTGASRGIGAAIANRLAEMGYQVIGTATSESGAEIITKHLKANGDFNEGRVLNLSDQDGIQAFIEALVADEKMPDVLINNAGITRDHLFIKLKPEDIEAVIQTNLLATIQLTQLCVRAMVRKKWGRVVNLGSVVGSSGNPGQTSYCASKAGLLGFSRALALELASRSITVNTVSPGFIDTDMTRTLNEKQREAILTKVPMKRLGIPEDIAASVAFLVSPSGDYITGQNLHVNGGLYLS